MEPPEASISEKIHQLFDKIAKHGDTATEKFRTLALIDWIIMTEGWRLLNPEELQRLNELKNVIAGKRKELKGTKEDLRLMPVPSGEARRESGDVVGEREKDYFPRYLELPGLVVREKIMGYLTSAQDKLNLLEAIPSEIDLKLEESWNIQNLQFELVFPILMEQLDFWSRRKPRVPLPNWVDIYNLGRVSPFFQEVVERQVKSALAQENPEFLYLFQPYYLKDVLDVISDPDANNEPEWFQRTPIPIKVTLSLRDDNEFSGSEQWQLGQLPVWGGRILDCLFGLDVPDNMPSLDVARKISNCLRLMPNLINLQVCVGSTHRMYSPELQSEVETQWTSIRNCPLPELPSLKSLDLYFDCDPRAEAVNRLLLLKYGPPLQHLKLNELFPFHQHVVLRSSTLSTLQLMIKMYEDRAADFRQYFAIFAACPLKTIRLLVEFREEDDGIPHRDELPRLLALLSHYFGGTLEKLKLRVHPPVFGMGAEPRATVLSSTWMMNCKFPKLKEFSMDPFPARVADAAFLLLFPVLEKLSFKGRYDFAVALDENEDALDENEDALDEHEDALDENENALVEHENALDEHDDALDATVEPNQIFDLYEDLEKMRTSNIWKLIPSLKEFKIDESLLHRNECVPSSRD